MARTGEAFEVREEERGEPTLRLENLYAGAEASWGRRMVTTRGEDIVLRLKFLR